MLNYDTSSRYAVQRVRIRYAQHHFQHTAEVEVRGTDRGLETLEWALELHWEQLAKASEVPTLILRSASGHELLVQDDALLQVEWLKEFCVGLEILSIEPCDLPQAGRAG